MEIFRQITANNLEMREYPFLKELAMEAYLIENEEILKLDNTNFAEVEIIDAEVTLKEGQKTSNRDGRIDIFAQYGLDYLAIVELKVGEINDETLIQLEDYLKVREQLKSKYETLPKESKWVGVVVGKSISASLQEKLSSGYVTSEGIPVAGMTLKRFRSCENDIFVISDTYFKWKYSTKDYSTFVFNGREYNKSRLPHAVINFYLQDKGSVTFHELNNLFPNTSKLKTAGVFDTFERAERIMTETGHKRHYIKIDEVIQLKDYQIAVSNQWSLSSIQAFIKDVQNYLGYSIQVK